MKTASKKFTWRRLGVAALAAAITLTAMLTGVVFATFAPPQTYAFTPPAQADFTLAGKIFSRLSQGLNRAELRLRLSPEEINSLLRIAMAACAEPGGEAPEQSLFYARFSDARLELRFPLDTGVKLLRGGNINVALSGRVGLEPGGDIQIQIDSCKLGRMVCPRAQAEKIAREQFERLLQEDPRIRTAVKAVKSFTLGAEGADVVFYPRKLLSALMR